MRRISSKTLKILGTGLVAILIGAIGSGVWESLLGPGLRGARNWILESISIVFRNYKNDIYMQIARDSGGGANSEIISLISSIYFGLSIAVVLYYAFSLLDMQARNDSLVRKLSPSADVPSKPEMTLDQARIEVLKLATKMRRAWALVYLIAGVLAILVTSHTISSARVSYVEAALAHYHQSLRITSPYLTTDERLAIESQFAQIKNRQAYVVVLNRLNDAATTHGQSVPAFEVW